MAAAGLGNPVGAVPIFDGGAPRIVGGVARQNLSGGVFAFASGADAIVSSGADSFVTADIQFAGDGSGLQFNGIVVQDTASGNEVAVATRGAFILVSNGTVTAGYPVVCDGNNAVANAAGSPSAIIQVNAAIGRALTSAGSEEYCIVDINA
jgi:hypothetical protein